MRSVRIASMLMLCVAGVSGITGITGAQSSTAKRPIRVGDMYRVKNIGDPQISPEGKLVAFRVQTVDVDANKKPVQIWIVPLSGEIRHRLPEAI